MPFAEAMLELGLLDIQRQSGHMDYIPNVEIIPKKIVDIVLSVE